LNFQALDLDIEAKDYHLNYFFGFSAWPYLLFCLCFSSLVIFFSFLFLIIVTVQRDFIAIFPHMHTMYIDPGIRRGRMKLSSGGGEFKYDIFDTL
jgi:hypothetical protein